MALPRLSRLWNRIRGRSPRQHVAALRKRMEQAEDLERACGDELIRMCWHGETRAIKWASRRLSRIRRRTDRLSRALDVAEKFLR